MRRAADHYDNGSVSRQWIEESHVVLAYVLAAVVLIHVLAALRHHMLKRNDVLRRMIWSVRL